MGILNVGSGETLHDFARHMRAKLKFGEPLRDFFTNDRIFPDRTMGEVLTEVD